MALDTYAGLQAAIADYAHNDDIAERIPDFIRSAELAIHRRLRVFPKEVESSLTLASGARAVTLPAGFGSPIALWDVSGGQRCELFMMLPEALPVDAKNTGAPRFWAIDRTSIALDKASDKARQILLRYLQAAYLSDSVQTTPLFARAPDLYLYGALSFAAPYCRDNAQAATWRAEYLRILREVATEGARSKDAELRTELPGLLGCYTRNLGGN